MLLLVSQLGEGMVGPCEATPSDSLSLSLIDALPGLRPKVRSLHVFRHGPNAAAVIRAALSRALVHYYPLAGRLIESPLLQLACTGEGVWFVEASSQCNLEAIDYLDNENLEWRLQLLPQPPQEKDGFEPLLLVQVTQFECGGFVMGLEFSHSVCDGLGAAQFLKAVGESARGLQLPTIPPAWCRESLPAQPIAHAILQPPPPPPPSYVEEHNRPLKHADIDISSDSIALLKRQFWEITGKPCSTFEVLAARVWKCRAQAITYNNSTAADGANHNNLNGDDATLVFFSNARRLVVPPLPQGFYGNCIFPVVVSLPLEKLRCTSHVETVKLIQEAKAKLPSQFAKWVGRTETDDDDDDGYMDPFGAAPLSYATLFVSEWGRLGFGDVDYGWGPPIYFVPADYSGTIPICIVGCPPSPDKGVRLMTWCVEDSHLNIFRQLLMNKP